jgi:hypothetical protein
MSTVGAERERAVGARPWGRFHGLAASIALAPAAVPLLGAVGIGTTAAAFGLARTGRADHLPSLLFWLGLILIFAPAAAHLIARRTSRTDRLRVIAFTALSTYAVKVLHDPSAFGFSDEYIHLAATQKLHSAQALFATLPVAGSSVAADYPGLHATTVALSDITTLPLFICGVIVIALARLILMVALFLLFEQIVDSARVAGMGALLYAAGPNFLYFTAQFSYESLSLPLFIAALAVASTLGGGARRDRLQPAVCAVLLTLAITMTHHLTSYALAATFTILTIMAIRPAWRRTRATGLAAVAIAAPVAWFGLVAAGTGAYLGYVFNRTLDAVTNVGEGGTRRPFETTAGLETPLLERVLAIASAAVVCIGILVAVRELRRRRAPITAPGALLIAASLAFLLLFPLKVLPGAWETANRSSDFLFIGAAILLAGLLVRRVAAARRPRLALTVTVVLVTAVICGGVIQGWPSDLRLAQSTEAESHGVRITAPGLAASRWAIAHLPADAVYLGDEATGRELAVLGAARVYPGRAAQAPQLFEDATLPTWQRDLLLRDHIGFVVLDRRRMTANNLAGYFLQPTDVPDAGFGYYPATVRAKFGRISRSRTVFDSGDIAIFDIRGLAGARPACSAVSDRTWSEPFACDTSNTVHWYGGDRDDTVRMPGARFAVVATRVEPRVDGTHVTVRLRILNSGQTTIAPDPTEQAITLSTAGDLVPRQRHRTSREDDLATRTRVRPDRQIERSVTFVLNARHAATLERGDTMLRIRRPETSAGARPNIGYVRLAPPFEESGS